MKKGEFVKSLLNLSGSLYTNGYRTSFSTPYFSQNRTKKMLLLLYAGRHTLIRPDYSGFPRLPLNFFFS
jgi:hypothetical protein